jgi:multicomponent Na+:H+ antiporter subunit D
MNNSLILLAAVPLLGSAGAITEKIFPRLRWGRWGSLLSLLACGCILARLLPALKDGPIMYSLGNWPGMIRITLIMDGLVWLCGAITLFVSFAVLLYVFSDSGYGGHFHFFFLVMVGSIFGLVLTEDIFNMFVFMEILGFSSYILIAYEKKPQALVASFNYMLASSLAISFFLIGVFVIYTMTGTLSLTEAGIRLARPLAPQETAALNLGLVCFILGLGIRAAFMPFHAWLPEAHAHAPHPVSALLSGIMIKVSFVSLWRIIQLYGRWDTGPVFLWAGAVTAFGGVLLALIQSDIKKLLAFHSISQMGYILAAFGAGSAVSLTASCYHILNHAIFKSLLFLAAGTVITAVRERNIYRLGGLGAKLPGVAVPFAAAAFSIAGMPPWGGYISKQLISAGLAGSPAYILIWLTGTGTAASFIKLSSMFFPKKINYADGVTHPTPPPKSAYPPLFLLAAACLALGLFPAWWTNFFASLLKDTMPAAAVPFLSDSNPYRLSALGGAALTLAAGFAICFAVMSRRGQKFTHRIERFKPGLGGTLCLLLAGIPIFFFALSL